MSSPDTVIASLSETRLTLAGLLRWLRLQGRLAPLVRQALAAQFVQEQARQAGLSATDEELQAAADDFRRRSHLSTRDDAHAWLSSRGLSVDDFESAVEQDVLAAKMRQYLTDAEADGHFAVQQAGLERLRLTLVLAPREDLAQELVTQVREEGRDLEGAAREQGLELVRCDKLRKELTGPLGVALRPAAAGELVGPVSTRRGFAIVVIEECHPAEPGPTTRRCIQDEMFEVWLAARLREAKFDLALAGAPG
jgi:hypothetical protein